MANSGRRKFLQTGMAAMAVAAEKDINKLLPSPGGSSLAASPAALGKPTKRIRLSKPYRLIVNDDGGRGYWNWAPPLTAEQYLDAVCGVQVAGKAVDALFWCGLQNPSGNARYNTRVGEVAGAGMERFQTAGYWATITTLRGMISQGHDPLALICKRCHELGRDAWLSLRFNDAHHVYRGGDHTRRHIKTTRFFLQRPDLRMGPNHGWKRGYVERQWDYTRPEVRNRVYALLEEAYMDYDVDGVELDFMRHPSFFPKAQVKEGSDLLNGLMSRLRRLADQAAEKKGRSQGLAVRVPSHEPACGEIGLDWRTWVQEGWVDVLTASCFHSAEQEAELAPFVEGCRDSRTLVYWCVESTPGFPNAEIHRTLLWGVYGGQPTGPGRDHYRAMALGAYEQGVDGLYFFNTHFAFERLDTHPEAGFLGELQDPELLRSRDQTYLVSRQTHDSHDSFFQSAPPRPLPRTLTPEEPECLLGITVGADLQQAAASKRLRSVRLRLCLRGVTPLDRLAVIWDGEELAGEFQPPAVSGTWQVYNGVHFWIADLLSPGRAPQRGKHECRVRLRQRNPVIEEGIEVEFAELAVRYWRKPGLPDS